MLFPNASYALDSKRSPTVSAQKNNEPRRVLASRDKTHVAMPKSILKRALETPRAKLETKMHMPPTLDHCDSGSDSMILTPRVQPPSRSQSPMTISSPLSPRMNSPRSPLIQSKSRSGSISNAGRVDHANQNRGASLSSNG